MPTIGTKSSNRTQNLPRREAQTVRLESEHSGRNQPKKKHNQRLTLSWTEEDPEVQRWSSLKHSQQTYLEEICLLLLVINTIQCTFTLLCTQCVQVISLKTVRRTKLPCTSHNNFKPKIIQYKTASTFYNYLDYSGYKPYRANLNVELTESRP